nr:kinesin-1 heavy chain-like [Maniola hyperantus]
MDINRIKNTIIRRNLVEDVSRIKAKISEDNKRIVQIQVNRDTVLGELERQFAELKGDHERLQQNMLELQAQHEALSSQYEQELRHRAETLHKCEGTRKISEVLERGEEQAQLRFAQTKKDVAMIGEVYRQADLQVQNLMQTYVTKTAEAKQRYDKLKSQAKQMRIHELQMLEMYNENKNRVEATLREMCALQSHADELQRKYDVTSAELDKRNSEISTLQREKRNIINNINSQMTEANNILSKKDNDLKSAGEEIEALKKALANQEQFAKMQGDQNNELQEKMALMEEEHQKVIETNEKNYKTKIEVRNPKKMNETKYHVSK